MVDCLGGALGEHATSFLVVDSHNGVIRRAIILCQNAEGNLVMQQTNQSMKEFAFPTKVRVTFNVRVRSFCTQILSRFKGRYISQTVLLDIMAATVAF